MRISDWSSDVCSSDLAEVVANDSLRLGELPEQLQEIVGRLQVGEATPPFGSLADGVRVLILCGRDEGSVSTPSFDQVYAQLNEQRVRMRAPRYLRDLRRHAIHSEALRGGKECVRTCRLWWSPFN